MYLNGLLISAAEEAVKRPVFKHLHLRKYICAYLNTGGI